MQTAVDAEHHLIVAHEVLNECVDRGQLSTMAETARQAIEADALGLVADRGYFRAEPILDCTNAGITAVVPKALTTGGFPVSQTWQRNPIGRSTWLRRGFGQMLRAHAERDSALAKVDGQ